jgi:hypothetical protein
MKARTSVLIVFVAAVFVLATVSHGYAAQTTSSQERSVQQNQPGNTDLSGSENGQNSVTNEAGSQAQTPPIGNTGRPVVVKHVGWSWLLITGLIGYLLGRITSRRRPYRTGEDIRRDRVA